MFAFPVALIFLFLGYLFGYSFHISSDSPGSGSAKEKRKQKRTQKLLIPAASSRPNPFLFFLLPRHPLSLSMVLFVSLACYTCTILFSESGDILLFNPLCLSSRVFCVVVYSVMCSFSFSFSFLIVHVAGACLSTRTCAPALASLLAREKCLACML